MSASGPAISVSVDAEGRPFVEVTIGVAYVYAASGACEPALAPHVLCERPIYRDDLEYPGLYRPPVLRRDAELHARRRGTDVVVQGIWRARGGAAVRQATCALECRGAATFKHVIALSGDRVVERGPAGPRISGPEPFTELPIRYDRAYGGTDEASARRDPDPYEEALRGVVSDAVFYASSTYSYPRNPAGRGYVVDARSLVGARLPNLEWPGAEVTIERMVLPLDRWDERPLPACFDWYGHGWFPRVAFADEFEPTRDDRTPAAEVALGIVPADLRRRPLIERMSDAFHQGAHPLLWRHRLRGDEHLQIGGMSIDGGDARCRLPGVRPHVAAVVEGRALATTPAVLDVVFVETEARRVTLIWRASLAADDPTLPHRADLRADVAVDWRTL